MNKEIPNKYRRVIFILLAVVVLGLWFLFRSDVREIRNVVLISIDTCRADHLSCYGYRHKVTPNIDAIAAEGILFENVVAPVPITLPSHASMLTGTIPVYHGVHDNLDYRLGESNTTLAEILKGASFATGAAISAIVLESQFGLDQGFEVFDDRFKSPVKNSIVEQRRGGETTEVCLNWLEENKDKRFFYFLHYYDPHRAYAPPEPFASRFPGNPYVGEIAYTDHCIGRVIQKLKALDLYDSTLVIVTSDHGEMLGEHGERNHAYFIYESAIKVPLIFRVPGWNKAVSNKQLAGVIDIAPTVCSLLNIELPAAVQGVDLSPCFGGGALSAPRGMYCESLQATKYGANSLLGIVMDRFKYIQTTRPELYDLVKDPAESKNLIIEQPNRARILKDELAQIIQQSVRLDTADSKMELDDETRRRLAGLGYVGSGVVEDFEFDQTKDDPKDVLSYHLLYVQIGGYLDAQQYDQAKEMAEEMIRVRPDAAPGYQYAGQVAHRQRDHSSAVVYYHKALGINPDSAGANNNLAWTLATVEDEKLRDPAKAVRFAIRACELTQYARPDFLDTLAVAFAATDDFPKAIETAEKALELSADNEILIHEIRKHINLFKANKPYYNR
jgi:arylsulfatase A-like enzyme